MQGHNGDVAAMSLHPSQEGVFVTGSVDKTATAAVITTAVFSRPRSHRTRLSGLSIVIIIASEYREPQSVYIGGD